MFFVFPSASASVSRKMVELPAFGARRVLPLPVANGALREAVLVGS